MWVIPGTFTPPFVAVFLPSAEQVTERDKFLSAQEAKDFGIVDQVLHRSRPLDSSRGQ